MSTTRLSALNLQCSAFQFILLRTMTQYLKLNYHETHIVDTSH